MDDDVDENCSPVIWDGKGDALAAPCRIVIFTSGHDVMQITFCVRESLSVWNKQKKKSQKWDLQLESKKNFNTIFFNHTNIQKRIAANDICLLCEQKGA